MAVYVAKKRISFNFDYGPTFASRFPRELQAMPSNYREWSTPIFLYSFSFPLSYSFSLSSRNIILIILNLCTCIIHLFFFVVVIEDNFLPRQSWRGFFPTKRGKYKGNYIISNPTNFFFSFRFFISLRQFIIHYKLSFKCLVENEKKRKKLECIRNWWIRIIGYDGTWAKERKKRKEKWSEFWIFTCLYCDLNIFRSEGKKKKTSAGVVQERRRKERVKHDICFYSITFTRSHFNFYVIACSCPFPCSTLFLLPFYLASSTAGNFYR